MFCQKCGTEGAEGGFCTKCGTKLGGETPQPIEQQTAQQPIQPQAYQQPMYQQPVYQQPMYQQQAYQQPMYQQPPMYQQQSSQNNTDFSGFSPYYQKAFTEIENGGSGGFNWCAFIFGCFWALFKGAWLSAIVSGILVCCTAGIGVPIFWLIYGFKANRIMYKVKVKHKQVIF